MSVPTVLPRTIHTATVIFLHGLGDTGDGWNFALGQIAEPHIKYMCPTAPIQSVSLNAGMKMPSWFDIYSLSGTGPEDEKGIKASSEKLKQLIELEIKNGIPSDRIVIGGFSQGGAVALYTALTYEKRLGGLVGLSCFLPLHKHFPETQVGNKDTPFFLAHGDSDMLVHASLGQKSYEYTKKMNSRTEFKLYKGMGHSSSEEEMMDVRSFIRRVLPSNT